MHTNTIVIVLQDLANDTISKFVPEFVTQGLIDHDYTILAMRRYAEASRHFWADIIKNGKQQQASVIEPLQTFLSGDLKRFKEAKSAFELAQQRYDHQLAKYLAYSKNKEPSVLRDDAFILADTRKSYIKASFNLSTVMPVVQAKLDVCLVKTFASPWILKPNKFLSADLTMQRISVEMLRLKSWSRAMQKSFDPLNKEMMTAAANMQKAAISKFKPSKDLNTYTAQTSSFSHFIPLPLEKSDGLIEKHGWLLLKVPNGKGNRPTWVRRWVFLKDGLFGMLNLSPSKTYVQESDKIGVLLCYVTSVATEDRRFCLEIKTQETSIILQAENLEELTSWLQVFENAKRTAVESDKKSDISYAFKQIPPLIAEFANTTESVPLVSEALTGTTSTLNSSSRISTNTISLRDNVEALNIQAMMSAGDPIVNSDVNDSSKPFGVSLTPSPLLNISMPTAKSQEAILSHNFISSSTVPNAITANYWGSVNWSLYHNALIRFDRHYDPEDDAVKPSPVIQSSIPSYPSYYPLELRSQDAQVRAIFHSNVGDSLDDKVVLVFRCMYKPNAEQQIPGRVYATATHLYMYSHFLGMSSTAIASLTEIVSVEIRANIHYDVMYLIIKDGTSSCTLFLDSGRVLQKRIQFLIDNAHSPNPLSLQDLIEKLKSFVVEIKKEDIMDLDPLTNASDPRTLAMIGMDDVDEIEQKYFQLYVKRIMQGSTNGRKGLIGLLPPKSFASTEMTPPKRSNSVDFSLEGQFSDMSKLMSQLSLEHEFDIPAKALFHIMFGENSPVFTYQVSGLIKRVGIELLPWKLIESKRLEREIIFDIVDSKMNLDIDKEGAMFTQRLEKMENNQCYIVYERRAIWKLPQGGSFYTTFRYVIIKTTNNGCKLSIWSSVEWLRSTIFKNVTEGLVQKMLTQEAGTILSRVLNCRAQLGPKGSTTTAIRLFGKLGAGFNSEISTINITDSLYTPETVADTNNVIVVSPGFMKKNIIEAIISSVISIFGEICLLVTQIARVLFKVFMSHYILFLILFGSTIFNLFLIGKSTQSYWMERRTENLAFDLGLVPGSQSIMRRSILLQDVENLIMNGSHFSVEKALSSELGHESKSSLCYNKFQSLALLPETELTSYETYSPEGFNLKIENLSNETSDDFIGLRSIVPSDHWILNKEPLFAIRNRIFDMRSRLGIHRNALMVEMRTVNQVETDLLMAEWRAWVQDEVSICSRVVQDFSLLQNEFRFLSVQDRKPDVIGLERDEPDADWLRRLYEFHDKRKVYDNEDERKNFLRLLKSLSNEMKQFISTYCKSCSNEMGAILDGVNEYKLAL